MPSWEEAGDALKSAPHLLCSGFWNSNIEFLSLAPKLWLLDHEGMLRCEVRREDALDFGFPGLVHRSFHWAAGMQLMGGAGLWACRPLSVLLPQVGA